VSKPGWLGKDEIGGVASEARPDRKPPPNWRQQSVFATPRPHDLAVSPDGSRVAFVLDIEGTTDIWVVTIDTSRVARLTTDRGLAAYWEDSAPVWSPDGATLAYDSAGDVCVVPSAGGPPRRLLAGSSGAWIDDRHLAVSIEHERVSRLSVIDIDDPWPSPLGPANGDVGQVCVAHDGRMVTTFWPKDDLSRIDILVIDPGGEWRTLAGHPGRRAGSPAVDGNRVAYALEDGNRTAVFITDLDGAGHHKLAAGDQDFSDLAWLPEERGLVAIATSRGQSDLVTISLDGEVGLLGEGGSWQTPVVTSGGVVAVHEAFDAPATVVLVSEDGGRSALYDGTPEAVRVAPHAKLERITFQSSGDLEIEGFLFRPSDTSSPVPAVVYPHGGPTSLYADEWDGHAQYFVDKGYAWLAINFRGSTSYGLEFERANHRNWGLGDVDDCLAAANHLAGLGWVDPGRIAIFGASYGAYLALASVVRPDNPFACAVSKYGDCDVLTSWAQGDRTGVEDLERMMGHPSENREGYRAASPIHDIGRITKPILIAHGEHDARVHPRQSQELVDALARVQATYEYITYPTEGHGLLRREPQLHFYQRLERFLDWYLM